jgi:hypothetical protein
MGKGEDKIKEVSHIFYRAKGGMQRKRTKAKKRVAQKSRERKEQSATHLN